MTEDEIKKFINKCLDKRLQDFRNGYIKRIKEYEIEINKKIMANYSNERIQSIESILRSQSIGLQNVYNEFSKLTDSDFLSGFNVKLHEFKNEFKKMKKEIDRCTEFMEKGHKKMSTISEFYSLGTLNPNFIKKIALIVKLLQDEEDY